MKHLFTSVILFTAMLASLPSCKKDKDDSPHQDNPYGSRIQEYENGDDFIRFEYNAEGIVQKTTVKTDLNTGGDLVDFNITYNANKKIDALTAADGRKIEAVYENNVLKRADIFQGVQKIAYTNYVFENNFLKTATIYAVQGNTSDPFLEFRFTYNAAGNATETIVLMAGGTPGQLLRSGHVIGEYDNKTNPLFEHRDLLALLLQPVSKNNITLENHFDENQQLEDRYTYTYTYKANGLPERAVVKNGLPGAPVNTSNIIFTYN